MADKRIVTVDYLNSEGLNKGYINNNFSNALKGSKSGSAILIDDVSPVTHEMGVKVRGKNLFDINGFINLTGNSTYYGINDNGELYVKQSDYREDTVIPAFITLEAGTYTLSSTTRITSNFKLINLTDNIVISLNNNATFSIEKATSLGIKYWQAADTVIGKLQLELGTTATSYTPYVSDLTAVKVSRYGKNLLPLADSGIYYNGSVTGGSPFIYNQSQLITDFNDIDISINRGVYAVIRLTEGETYTLTIKNLVNNCATKQIKLAVGFRSSENTIFGTSETSKTAISGYNSSSLTFTVPSGYPYCLVGFYNYPTVSGDTVSFDAMQLELGTTATDYEPYKECAEYTPNADGTVEGVTSLYPNTTLTTDTDGVLIDCEYNRDINKAFAELQQAIISLGGNV